MKFSLRESFGAFQTTNKEGRKRRNINWEEKGRNKIDDIKMKLKLHQCNKQKDQRAKNIIIII